MLSLGDADVAADADRPAEPGFQAQASSERMSPNMLVVTMTSKASGRRIKAAAAASTISSSSSMLGKLLSDFADLAKEQPIGQLEHVGFVYRGDLAAPVAGQLERRSGHGHACLGVILRIEKAVSSSDMNSPGPTNMLRSE